jgi:histone H3/H4
MPPKGRLTPFYYYYDAKVEELKEGGRSRVTPNEVMDYWRALSEAERQPWEEKAAAACAAYLKECTERERTLEGDEDEKSEEEGEEDEAEAEGDGAEGAEDDDTVAAALPLARVKRIFRANMDACKDPFNLGKEAAFAVVKAGEAFLERAVWDAANVTRRENRKRIDMRDLLQSMRVHPCPEAMQFFWEELQPEPPKVEAKPKSKASAKRKAPASKGGASKRAAKQETPAEEPAEAPEAPAASSPQKPAKEGAASRRMVRSSPRLAG